MLHLNLNLNFMFLLVLLQDEVSRRGDGKGRFGEKVPPRNARGLENEQRR